MSAEEFKQRVGQLLGVSSSERDMALDILLNKAADILEFFDAVKVRGLGIFQFRKDEAGRVDQNSILFVPAGAVKSPGKKFMYLTLKVNRPDTADDFDENLFSPGIGKKIISPDDSLEKTGGPEALRKHIEDKVDEILSESEQLEDFDIWKNYNLSSEEEETAEFSFGNEEAEKINFDEIAEEFSFDELTAPPSGSEEESTDVSEFDFEEELEFDSENERPESRTFDETELPEIEEVPEEFEADEEVVSFDSGIEDNADELTEDSGATPQNEYLESSIDIDFDFEKLSTSGSFEAEESIEHNSFEGEDAIKNRPPAFEQISVDDFDDDKEEEPAESEEDWFTFDDDEEEVEEDTEAEANSDTKPLPDEDAWDWGDEPGSEHEELEIIEPADEPVQEDDPDEHEDEDSLFQTLEREITEIKDEPVDIDGFEDNSDDGEDEDNEEKQTPEFNLPPIIDVKEGEPEEEEIKEEETSFLPPNENSEGNEDETEGEGNFDKKTWEEIYKDFEFDEVKKGSKKDEVKKLKAKTIGNKMFSRNILIIIVAMFILTSVALYFYLTSDSDDGYEPGSTPVTQTESNEEQPAENITQENPEDVDQKLDELIAEQEDQNQPEENIPEVNPPARNNPPVTNVEETKPEPVASGLYLDFSSATQVKHLIFRLNDEYYVQVASVRNAKSAEREAQRLRRLGQNAYVSESFIKSKNDTYFRVKRGPFSSLNEAESFSAGIK